jgi:hypothetical protein
MNFSNEKNKPLEVISEKELYENPGEYTDEYY